MRRILRHGARTAGGPARHTTERLLAGLVLACAVLAGPPARAAEVVPVGGYQFPPFVTLGPEGEPHGVTLDLLKVLNEHQDKWDFRFVLTSPSRRYRDFRAGRFDVIFFEDPGWGWRERDLPVKATTPFLGGGEVYVAKAKEGRDQAYFDAVTDKRLVGVRGYHYGFADFKADPDRLKDRFDIALVNGNAAGLRMVRKGRADVAVVTRAFLRRYLDRHPGQAETFLVSDRLDQRYRHRALVREGADTISAAALNRLLKRLDRAGVLPALWRRLGLMKAE